MGKRSKAQLDFDMAKHGWAFCNKPMLQGKVEQLRELAKRLKADDKRHETVDYIASVLATMEGENG